MKIFAMLTVALILSASIAFAETVTIECIGEVEYNQINQGIYADVNSGDAVLATFTVDSENWEPSPGGYGVRGYPINMDSFELTIGSVGPVGLVDPQPWDQTSYFCLRNADPVADGFYVANNIDSDYSLPRIDVPGGIDDYFAFHWSVGYTEDTFSSLDIMDAIGSYDYTGLTSFYTAIGDSWADAMGLIFIQTNITSGAVATEMTTMGAVKALYR